MHFAGKGTAETEEFMRKHFKKWAWLNVGDQFLHLAAIGIFVLAYSKLF
jgi:hypothetical protein